MSERLIGILVDSFWKILLPGLKMTIPLTVISFTFAMLIAVVVALIQHVKVPVLTQLCRFYIWVVRGDNDSITSFEDLNGKHTANSIASTYMLLAESYGAETVGVDTLDQTIEMVLTGRADATLNAEVSVYDYLRVHPEANIKIVALTDEASQVAIPVRKGEETLVAALNQAIQELAAEGELSRISVKYFGSDISGSSAAE